MGKQDDLADLLGVLRRRKEIETFYSKRLPRQARELANSAIGELNTVINIVQRKIEDRDRP